MTREQTSEGANGSALDFELWIEAEVVVGGITDFCNVLVTLADGRSWGLNVWTFDFVDTAKQETEAALDEAEILYMQPPDPFVKDLTRSTLERSLRSILSVEVPAHWTLVEEGTPVDENQRTRTFELSDQQRRFLAAGLNDWGGPSRCTEPMTIAMGFTSVQDLFDKTPRLVRSVRQNEPLSDDDWARVLLSAEVCFASSLGSRDDWEITTGIRDEHATELIRELQQVLGDVVAKLRGGELSWGPSGG